MNPRLVSNWLMWHHAFSLFFKHELEPMSQLGHVRKRQGKDGRNRYQMIVEVWKGGKKFYKAKTFATEKEAKSWGNKMRYEIETGHITKETLKNRKLSDAIEKYTIDVLPQKPKNARNVEQHLRWWNKQLGHLQLTEVTPGLVAECRDKLLKEPTQHNKTRAPATVVRYICSLSSVFETAIKEWHWIEKNPVRNIRKPTVSNARIRFLTKDECEKLLKCCKESRNPYLYPIVVLALSTGMRRGEILNLRYQDLDFNNKLITLRKTKNGSIGYVPMVANSFKILKTIFDSEKVIDLEHHLFPGLNLNRYLDIRTAWLFALKRAGIEGFTFHSLRHSCASFLAMSGATSREIAQILNQKDVRMADRYSHLTRGHTAEVLERATEKFMGEV